MTAHAKWFAGRVRRTELSCQRCPATITVRGHGPGHARQHAETEGWRSDWEHDADWCPSHALHCPVMTVTLPPLPPGAVRWDIR